MIKVSRDYYPKDTVSLILVHYGDDVFTVIEEDADFLVQKLKRLAELEEEEDRRRQQVHPAGTGDGSAGLQEQRG